MNGRAADRRAPSPTSCRKSAAPLSAASASYRARSSPAGRKSSASITPRSACPESIRFPPGEKSEGILQLVVLPAHAPLIQHVIPEIIERVNRFFGYKAVARVKMRQGEVKPRTCSG